MTSEQIREAAFHNKPAPIDTRPFIIRLLSSLRVCVKPKLSGGRILPSVEIKGGTDF
jgi:hypothetical protein